MDRFGLGIVGLDCTVERLEVGVINGEGEWLDQRSPFILQQLTCSRVDRRRCWQLIGARSAVKGHLRGPDRFQVGSQLRHTPPRTLRGNRRGQYEYGASAPLLYLSDI